MAAQVTHVTPSASTPVPGDRPRDVLLSALAEAPDFRAAAVYLLEEVQTMLGARRALLFQFEPTDECLVLSERSDRDRDVDGNGASTEPRFTILDRNHPWLIAALTLSPVVGANIDAGPADSVYESWTALPMPQPHFRGAPAIWSDGVAMRALESSGARLIPLRQRRFSSAPGGVIVAEGLADDSCIQAAAAVAMLAGPVMGRLAALEAAEARSERGAQQEARLQQMLDSLPDPVIITNATNDIITQNRRAEHLLFPRDDDSAGRRRAVEVNNLLFTSFLSRAVMTGGPQSGSRELNLVDPDEGNDLLFEVLAHPMGERVGPEDAFLSVLRDVTDLRRAANELERQIQRVRRAEVIATGERDRLNLILESVADPILVTDDQANIILMNDHAERLFQVGNRTMRSRAERFAIQGNDTKFTSFISDFMLQEEVARRERMTLLVPDAKAELPVEVIAGKIRNERGEPVAIVSVLHDLTKHVENERLYLALKELNSELEGRIAAATADLADQNARLHEKSEEVERANKLKSDFLASMSHELRTPINAIIGYSALLAEGVHGPLTESQLEPLRRSRSAAQHLLALINDILDLARIEAGKMRIDVEDVSLADVFREVSQHVEPMVRGKGIAFEVDVPADSPVLQTDRTKIKQILLNLLSNAIKFTNSGSIRLSARRAGDDVYIEVRDTGIGIKAEDLDTIWEDFRQLDQSRTRAHGGTGLGLSITRRLLHQLGGRVSVVSAVRKGTTFSVYLPLRLPESARAMSTVDDVPGRAPAEGSAA
jgi:PAS domain S-box-containing protein